MFNELKVWIEVILGRRYIYSRGAWIDGPNVEYICAIYATGGSAIDVEDRRPRFRVLLVGPQQNKQAAGLISNDIEKLVQASLDSAPPCGAASLRVITEPSGPGYTEENRAWFSVDFQITY